MTTLGEGLEIVALGGVDSSALPSGIGHIAEPPHPPTNAGWTLVGLPRAATRGRVDLIHAPAYTAPLWSRVPVVLTIHDVSYARHPEWYPYRRDWVRRSFYRRSARAASEIITDSTFSAQEIAAAYAIPLDRITIIPLGVEPGFGPGDSATPPVLPSEVASPYLLHVGDLHERRNLGVVVEAMIEARRHVGALPALSLVLAGTDRGIGDALCEIAARGGAPGSVIRLGAVGEDALMALYRSAAAFVYPSLYEGFGLPVLEAMACGTPVIASHAASMPEVLGNAGVLLDPRDVRGWAQAIVKVVNDDDFRSGLRAAGLARSAAFTWERTARMTLEVYRRAA